MAKKKPYQRAERQRQLARQAEREAYRRRRTITVIAATISVLAVIGVVLGLSLTGDGEPAAQSPDPTSTASPEPPASIPTAMAPAPKRPTPLPETVQCRYPATTEPAAKDVKAPTGGKVSARGTTRVTLHTTAGDLRLTLDRSLAPCAVNSFVNLVKHKYYDNTGCHRLTVGEGLQVLQCGDPTGSGGGGPGYSFADEVFGSLKYGRGTLAMANSGADTNGSQFFIVYGDASSLQPKYTAFGTFDAASLEIVDGIARSGAIPEVPGTGDGRPATPIQIIQAAVAAD